LKTSVHSEGLGDVLLEATCSLLIIFLSLFQL